MTPDAETGLPPLQLVQQQALDEGLWFKAETAAEAYLQQELRRLHAAGESSALSTSQAAGVPDGWKLVPIEPTKEMLNAADIDPIASAETGHDEYRAIYAAMLAAAPEQQEAK